MKYLPLTLAGTLLLGACSKTVKEIHYTNGESPSVSKSPLAPVNQKKEIELIQELLRGGIPDLVFAELLLRTVSQDQLGEITKAIYDSPPGVAQNILKLNLRDSEAIQQSFLFHQQGYQNNRAFIEDSLLNPKHLSRISVSAEEKLKLSIFTYAKNKALSEVISSFKKRSLILAEEIAPSLARELIKSEAYLESSASQDSKEEFINKLLAYQPYVETLDKYFKNSSLNDNEQYVVVAGAVIAGAIYSGLKDNKGFQNFIKEAQKVASDGITIYNKAKELHALVATLQTHINSTKKNVSDLKEGLQGLESDLTFVYGEAKAAKDKSSNIHSKRMFDFLYKTVVNGEKAVGGSSIFSRPVRISENFTKTVNATESFTSNLSNILSTAEKISGVLGVRLSKDTMKVIETANKVATVTKLTSTAIQAFATGGVSGAFAALGAVGLGGLSPFGGGADYSAEFAQINRKLDQLLEGQKQIMDMQLETMKMVKDLAIMVDEYHQKEMRALAELRDYSLVSLELQRLALNKDLRHCERLINYQLSSIWSTEKAYSQNKFDIYSLDILKQHFYKRINSLNDIRNAVSSGGDNSFASCLDGVADAFGSEISKENPVLSIFMTTEEDQLYRWQRDVYSPLLNYVVSLNKTHDFDTVPLHIPSANMKGLKYKDQFLRTVEKSAKPFSENYELEDLISASSLERHLTRYLVLYPILEEDKSIWESSLEEIVQKRLANSDRKENYNSRSFHNLRNALRMIQTAIAQETILAGEPFLLSLYENFHQDLLLKKNCDEENSFVCTVKDNKLIMKNFLNLIASMNAKNQGKDFSILYSKAYENKDIKTLAAIFHPQLAPERITVQDDLYKLDNKYSLPTVEEFINESISYSENMNKLLKMQTLVLEALGQIAPLKRASSDDAQLDFIVLKNTL